LFLRGLSLFHGWNPVPADLSRREARLRPARRLPAWTVLAWGADPDLLFSSCRGPEPEPGLKPVEHQLRVRARAITQRRTLGIAVGVWVAGMMIGMPLLLFLPAHALMTRVKSALRPRTEGLAMRHAIWTIAPRLALRELRGGVGADFYVFIACIALGVMAIFGAFGLGRNRGLGGGHRAARGRVILGGRSVRSI